MASALPPSLQTTNAAANYAIAAVARSLELLHALQLLAPARLSDLAAAAGCTRPAAFRLLHTLAAHGYALQDGARGNWRLGPRLLSIAQAAEAQGALAAAILPLLRPEAAALGENLYLLVLSGLEAEVATLAGANDPIRRYAEPGQRLPLHVGPCRLLLAHSPAWVQTRILAQPLARLTPDTRTDRSALAAELIRLRNRPALVCHNDLAAGATSVAVPVQDAGGLVCAVLCIISPGFRLGARRAADLSAALIALAARLGTALGAPAALPAPPTATPDQPG